MRLLGFFFFYLVLDLHRAVPRRGLVEALGAPRREEEGELAVLTLAEGTDRFEARRREEDGRQHPRRSPASCLLKTAHDERGMIAPFLRCVRAFAQWVAGGR